MKKIFPIAIAAVTVFMSAGLGLALMPIGQAQAALLPTSYSTNFSGQSGAIYVNASGPFTEDFTFQLCDQTGTCTAPIWASQAGAAGTWSAWTWPGSKDKLTSLQPLINNVRALPAGMVIGNLRIGFSLAEANGGPGSIGAYPNGAYCSNAFTPLGGGWSGTIASYTHGNCSSYSTTPDDYRMFVAASVVPLSNYEQVTMSSNLPSTMSANQTIASSTITVNNTGQTDLASSNWTAKIPAGSVGSGNCEKDTDGDGIKDSPDPALHPKVVIAGTISTDPPGEPTAPPAVSCTLPVVLTANDLFITHTPSTFVTAATLPFSIVTTLTNTYQPAYQYTINCNVLGLLAPRQALAAPPGNLGGCKPLIQTFRIPASSSSVYAATPDIAAGTSAAFTIPTFTAPAAAGSYTEVWTLSYQGSGVPGGVLSVPITITNPNSGTINVVSVNSVSGYGVSSAWNFAGSVTGAPTCAGATCTGTTGTYASVPAGNVSDSYVINPSASAPAGYAFSGVERGTALASAKGSTFIAFVTRFLFGGTARAETTCAFVNSGAPSCASTNPTLTLANAGDTGNFTIKWDPIGKIDVNSSTVYLTFSGSSYVGTFTIADQTGTASSSVSNLAASTNYGGGPSGWLSISSLAGVTLNQGAAPQSVSLTAASIPVGCSAGCSALVTLTGVTANGHATSSVGVTVSLQPAPAPTLTLSASPTSVTLGSSATLTWAATNVTTCTKSAAPAEADWTGSTAVLSGTASVKPLAVGSVVYSMNCTGPNGSIATSTTVTATAVGGVTVTGVSLSCVPSSVAVGGTAQCAATTTKSDGTTDNLETWSVSSGTLGSITSGGLFTGIASGTVNIKATSVDDATKSATTPESILSILCSIGANPNVVILPNPTKITYSCAPVPVTYLCSLLGNSSQLLNLNPHTANVTGTVSETPTSTTQYTILCADPSGTSQASSNVTVSTANPGPVECNPFTNPFGCPQ
ncbi:MAG TPA: Ig-like domain-containing protein [Candidatus Paceibacterota bacterium]|nr:Ig-like domain-containing protein [Candidatus Paceibacterota bacterium]